MKHFIRDYFTFNKRERNGVFVFLTIICSQIIWLAFADKFVAARQVDFKEFDKQAEKINLLLTATDNDSALQTEEKQTAIFPQENKKLKDAERFYFNPNNLDEKTWKRLGLSDKQIAVIKNYEKKGGTFRTKNDFKKMYCIPNELFVSLETFIQLEELPDPDEKKASPAVFANKEVFHLLELNTADSAQLTKLRGIGATFASRIIKYRNLLGGFIKKEQLLEVWNFDSNKLSEIENHISIDASKIKRININVCSTQELKHPYLKWNQGNAIVNYREKHGKYKAVDEIKQTDLVDDETLRKIAPYLTVD